MNKPRILTDAMTQTPGWRVAAQEMITWGWELDDHAEYHGSLMVNQLMTGDLTIPELKGGIAWVNALDKEIAQTTNGGHIEELGPDDRLEATAVRLAHHAGRFALQEVKSSRYLETLRVRNQVSSASMPGMGGINERKYALE